MPSGIGSWRKRENSAGSSAADRVKNEEAENLSLTWRTLINATPLERSRLQGGRRFACLL